MGKTGRAASPTLAQKKAMRSAGLDWRNWLVMRDDPVSILIVNKRSRKTREIYK